MFKVHLKNRQEVGGEGQEGRQGRRGAGRDTGSRKGRQKEGGGGPRPISILNLGQSKKLLSNTPKVSPPLQGLDFYFKLDYGKMKGKFEKSSYSQYPNKGIFSSPIAFAVFLIQFPASPSMPAAKHRCEENTTGLYRQKGSTTFTS